MNGVRAAAAITVAALMALVAIAITAGLNDRERVAYMLNLTEAPSSLRVSSCTSDAWTDMSITCDISIDPMQFPELLSGYGFSRAMSEDGSHSLGLPKLGTEFAVAGAFEASPSEFKYGGVVGVYADVPRKRAIVHLYIE